MRKIIAPMAMGAASWSGSAWLMSHFLHLSVPVSPFVGIGGIAGAFAGLVTYHAITFLEASSAKITSDNVATATTADDSDTEDLSEPVRLHLVSSNRPID